MSARIFSVGIVTLALTGCGPDYERTEITGIVPSPLGGEINFQHVYVPQGMPLKAHIVSLNDDNKLMDGQIRTSDPTIMDVIQGVGDRDFAFLGMKAGRTQIEIRADGELVLVLDAVVTEQPAAP